MGSIKRKADMIALKDRIQAKLAKKKMEKGQVKSSRPPRYDEVFFEGTKWLDSLAGEPQYMFDKLPGGR
jgi:hypothetical protein